MALQSASLFLYGFTITELNNSIDFKTASLGPEYNATLNNGYYSLTSLMNEIVRAMTVADPASTFTVTADRTIAGGTQNRVTITKLSGGFFSILFGTGTFASSSVATLIGFNTSDYTGFSTYQGYTTAGTSLIPNYTGYSYLGPDFNQKLFGQVNVSASGVKEAIVFNIQKFFQVQFKYIPQATWISIWTSFFQWAIQQRELEFTPEITSPTTFYEVTLEQTTGDGKGLAFKSREMLSESMPFLYDTGVMTFRLVTQASQFI